MYNFDNRLIKTIITETTYKSLLIRKKLKQNTNSINISYLYSLQ